MLKNSNIKVPTELLEDIYLYAESKFPEEACGLIVEDSRSLQFIPCANVSDYPENTFVISPSDYTRAEDVGVVRIVVHSHTLSNSNPSGADIVACNQSGVPWLIVSIPNRSETFTMPNNNKVPYEGRPFFHQLLDCWSLIVDYYDQELGITIPNFQRQDNWWSKGQNLYIDLSAEAGFDIITSEKPKKYDVIIMQIGAEVPNHGALYLGDNIILHHMSNRVSCRAVYGGYWEKNTWGLLRHRSLI